MLALFIGGLLLSAVQGIQSQPSLSHIAESPQSNTNLLRWIQRSSEEMLPVEGFRIPRIWLALGNRLAFRQIAQQMYEEPLGEKGLNAYQVKKLLFFSEASVESIK